MNLVELIEAYRDESQDAAEPYFCDDGRLIRFANEGQVEAARRAFLLADSTSDMCSVSYAANDAAVTLDPRILGVREASINGDRLSLKTAEEMACTWPNWRDDTLRGQPTRLIRGLDTGKLHLYPRPAASGVIQLSVYRLPLTKMSDEGDVPELREEWHQGLVNWMLHRAYGRRDADNFDATLSAEALMRFEAEFGKSHGARNEEWSRSASVSTPPPIA